MPVQTFVSALWSQAQPRSSGVSPPIVCARPPSRSFRLDQQHRQARLAHQPPRRRDARRTAADDRDVDLVAHALFHPVRPAGYLAASLNGCKSGEAIDPVGRKAVGPQRRHSSEREVDRTVAASAKAHPLYTNPPYPPKPGTAGTDGMIGGWAEGASAGGAVILVLGRGGPG